MSGLEPLFALALGLIVADPSSWSAPRGCPDRAWVEERMQHYLARSAAPRLETHGRIVLVDAGYRLELRVGEDVRTLEGTDCRRLAEAAALIMAVAADAVTVATTIVATESSAVVPEPEETQLGPEPDEPTVTTVSVAPPPARPNDERPTSNRAISGGLRPLFGVDGNILPGAGVGLGTAALLRGSGPWRVQVRGTYWMPRTVRVDDADAGARVWAAGGGVDGCWEPGRAAVFGLVCGGVEFGALGGSGFGTGIETRRATQLWSAATLGGGVGWSMTRVLALVLEAQLLVSLRRPAFHLDGLGPVHRAGSVGGRGFLGLEVRFP